MNKISLNPEDLRVESFATTPDTAAGRGTVHGADASETTCHQRICDCETNGMECDTDGCEDTLAFTCGPSCSFECSISCPLNTCAYSCEGTCHETCFC